MKQDIAIMPLAIRVQGEVVSSNLQEFRHQVSLRLGLLNYEPATDEEFGEAEEVVKVLSGLEEIVEKTRDDAMREAADLDKLFRGLAETKEEIRRARLELSRRITARKEELRAGIIRAALAGIDHFDKSPSTWPEVAQSTKGKRTLASLAEAAGKTVAKINKAIHANRVLLNEFAEQHGWDLIPDRADLERRPHLQGELSHRVEQKRLRDEWQATEKARKEAEAKLAAEQRKAMQRVADVREDEREQEEEKPQFHDTGVSPQATVPPMPVASGADEFAYILRPAVQEAATLIVAARKRLSDPRLIELAATFSASLNEAWVTLKKQYYNGN